MTEIIDLVASRRCDGGVATTRRGCRTGEKGVSHRRDTGASNKESNKESLSNSINRRLCYIGPAHLGDVPDAEVETAVLRQSRQRQSGRFLKGPIPLQQIAAAARLPGRALAVLLVIHHQVALSGKPWVTLPKDLLAELGVDRNAKARALHQLELAELIRVRRTPGRAARVGLSVRRALPLTS